MTFSIRIQALFREVRFSHPPTKFKFHFIVLFVMLHTNKQTKKQTNRLTGENTTSQVKERMQI